MRGAWEGKTVDLAQDKGRLSVREKEKRQELKGRREKDTKGHQKHSQHKDEAEKEKTQLGLQNHGADYFIPSVTDKSLP